MPYSLYPLVVTAGAGAAAAAEAAARRLQQRDENLLNDDGEEDLVDQETDREGEGGMGDGGVGRENDMAGAKAGEGWGRFWGGGREREGIKEGLR